MKECNLPTVALIYGGRGHESEVSVRGAERIMPLIDREKYRTVSVFIHKDGRWLCNGGEVFPALIGGVSGLCREGEMMPISCAIPILHGDFGEDGVVQGALENARISYVGCSVSAGAVCCDKAMTKLVAEALGIKTVPWLLAEDESDALKAEKKLGYPLFVKPCSLGSSVGAVVARNREELISALKNAFALDKRVIVEKYIHHPRELECGYFRGKCKEIFTNPGEIICEKDFYDYSSKYIDCDGTTLCPAAEVGEDIREQIKRHSATLVAAIGVRDLCRIDFFLSDGTLYFNEINTMPGFTADSLYPKMLDMAGIPPRELIEGLIENALGRA